MARKRVVSENPPADEVKPDVPGVTDPIPGAGDASVTDSDQAQQVIDKATPKTAKPKPGKKEAPVDPPVKLIRIVDGYGRRRQCAEGDFPYFKERGYKEE